MKFGGTARNFIFSFHMPLFFLLSGYTYRLAANKQEFWLHVRKGIRHLLLPCVLVAASSALAQWGMGSEHSISALWMAIQRMAVAFWWASGVDFHSHPGLGALWFLISLFWAEIFLDGIHLLFPNKDNGYIYTFLGILGVFLGIKENGCLRIWTLPLWLSFLCIWVCYGKSMRPKSKNMKNCCFSAL